MSRLRLIALATVALLASLLGGCRRPYRVGDHVLITWRGGYHPGVIVAVEGSARFRVHYDGYSDDWEEWISAVRIQGPVNASKAVSSVVPPTDTAPRLATSAPLSNQPPSVYKIGDRVRVEWHGSVYTSTVIAVLPGDRYRVHYDTYGDEWDENVGLNRIQRR